MARFVGSVWDNAKALCARNMKIRTRHALVAGRFLLMFAIITVTVFGDFSWLPKPIANLVGDRIQPKSAEAFEVDIDTAAAVTGSDHTNAGPTVVFTSDTNGYKFYRDGGNTCVYSKTTNRGESWNTAVAVDTQTDCIGIAVWYDKWTPGATGTAGTRIHIATIDTGNDDIFYNVLDTSNDTLGLATATTTDRLAAQIATLATGGNAVSITMATSGDLFASVDDTSDSFVMKCPATSTCTTNQNWLEAGSRPQDLANDYSTLVPLMNGNIMIINRDISADDIRSKIWSATSSAWTTTWVAVDAAATENAAYDVNVSAMISSSTGRIHLAYVADQATFGNGTQDIRTATFDNNAWTSRTAVVTNSARGIQNIALGTDQNDDTVYVAYTATSSNSFLTQNIYYKFSSSTMQSWSAEAGPLIASSTDLYGLSFNGASNQRIYLTWFDNIADDVVGDTIYDTAPGIRVGTTTSQVATARATSTNLWIGGAFALKENLRTRDVTSVTLTETGSIDAQTGLDNIKLFYESDTTYPYDCASVTYNATEPMFTFTNTEGFSSPNGTSTFATTTSISVGTSSALCLYPVMDVLNNAEDLSTIDIEIADPVNDVVASLGAEILPTTTVAITGSTTVYNDDLTLTHFHWRNDDGSEAGATSATAGVQDTNYNTYPFNTAKRLRIGLSNEGSTTTLPQQYRLEYAPKTFICAQETGWVDVGAVGGDWDMSNTVNLTDGNNTTNVALGTNGAVTDENTTFLSTNGGQRDTSSQTGVLTLGTTTFAELEFSVIASTTAAAGNAYCFRLTDAGEPLDIYTVYPQATIASDVLLTASGTQTATLDIETVDRYMGGMFVLQKQTVGSVDIQSVTIMASGTVDYQNDLDNVELWYDLDISAPYDCSSESYNGGELQYGSTDADGFTAAATSTFTETITLTQTQSMCLYTVLDVASTSSNGELLDIQIGDPQTDIVRSAGTIGPTNTLRILGITELVRGVPTQIHYHFRNDNGTETTATSRTNGTEDTNLTNMDKGTSTRLRIEVSNEGGTSTPSIQYRLEYAHKTGGSCSASGGWIDVGAAGGDWDMLNSANLTDGANTTNIASLLNGAVTDENTNFLASNAAVKDASSQVAGMILSSTTFAELEYSIVSSSTLAAENSTYCFRVSDAGTAIESYATYPEITLKNVRDFKVQRGVSGIGTGAGTYTITAGIDYVAPAASTSAFIRLTNTQHTGGGATTSVATQNADDSTVYITNPWNIRTSITFQRQTTAPANSTRFAWEIVEYVGPAGGDNEMVVRQQQVMTYGTASTSASGTPVTGVVDNNDVAVFITGVWNPDTVATNYDSMLTTAVWSPTTTRAGFNRGITGTDAVRVSYAVVEFTGVNWRVQRVEHAYTATGTAETENITAVNSTSRAFLHVQKRNLTSMNTHANYGHQVWLSSVGAVSFMLNGSSTAPTNHRSVAWVIENTQTKGSPMIVTRSNGTQSGGGQPLASSTNIGTTIDDVTESSIFANNSSTGSTTPTFPEPMMMFELIATSTTQYRLWTSNTTDTRSYRVEVVEWPAARREITQNDYLLYVNEDAIDPQDPWPAGPADLGENTAMTGFDQPTSNGSVVRIRMTLNVSGQSSMPPGIDSFKLQYGLRPGLSCSAITEWQDLGDAASTTAKWRAYDNASVTDGTLLSVNPPTAGHLNISVSDRAGTYEEQNDTAVTSYGVRSGEDIEFDWSVQNNNADEKASYCFRMVESDGTELDIYNSTYPTIRTVGYGAESYNWRWYDDSNVETPSTPLGGAGENVTPIDVQFNNAIALRLTLRESNGANGANAKFKIQFSESPEFTSATDVVSTSSCGELSYWCYATGSVPENSVITTKVLTDSESCAGGVGRGCGTHNASGTAASTFTHQATSSSEFSFTIRHANARANRTYYFRAYDVTNDEAVATAVGESYPSLTTEGATLTLTAESVATSTVIDGITTDVGTSPTAIPFGSFTGSTTKNAAYRFTVSTDATEGYQLYVFSRQGLLSNQGGVIDPVTSTNASPAGWATACLTNADGCFGYHASDDTLAGGSTRFAPNDSFAALESTAREVAQSSLPTTGDQVDVVYRVTTRSLQEAGQYSTNLVYIVVPVF